MANVHVNSVFNFKSNRETMAALHFDSDFLEHIFTQSFESQRQLLKYSAANVKMHCSFAIKYNEISIIIYMIYGKIQHSILAIVWPTQDSTLWHLFDLLKIPFLCSSLIEMVGAYRSSKFPSHAQHVNCKCSFTSYY